MFKLLNISTTNFKSVLFMALTFFCKLQTWYKNEILFSVEIIQILHSTSKPEDLILFFAETKTND